ncbi:hypothetical protein CDL15_Pgr012215 [Punica granatum]|nr:hypothetical protein CDL15_Pgr012215 [Punica granatum]
MRVLAIYTGAVWWWAGGNGPICKRKTQSQTPIPDGPALNSFNYCRCLPFFMMMCVPIRKQCLFGSPAMEMPIPSEMGHRVGAIRATQLRDSGLYVESSVLSSSPVPSYMRGCTVPSCT